jgi:hypothetical protein
MIHFCSIYTPKMSLINKTSLTASKLNQTLKPKAKMRLKKLPKRL